MQDRPASDSSSRQRDKRIADHAGRDRSGAESEVGEHLSHAVFAKLGFDNMAQWLRYAMDRGLA
jgi:hypothetical protein